MVAIQYGKGPFRVGMRIHRLSVPPEREDVEFHYLTVTRASSRSPIGYVTNRRTASWKNAEQDLGYVTKVLLANQGSFLDQSSDPAICSGRTLSRT